MKNLKLTLLFVFLGSAIISCNTTTAPSPVFNGSNPYVAQTGDDAMQRDEVMIDSSSLSIAESEPIQVTLNFTYFPPTPCHQLRVEIENPDAQNHIDVIAYSLTEKDKACVLMALVTPLDASLDLGSFPKGHYSLQLNGQVVGEFDS